ncbi:DUF6470 family protein [Virgibacillus sp. 179-BFC.A HS]|uniref:DUF6470 family protein n=1 Tax=Tigheibacillus jepli TaxID=3035914 RepID=A0ABU5CGX5_9BACI|nr:DUF6470 family protein [Virgibacillus sp. 179-BFC.A HS]MDY0405089.1 DUF6470 family protein [Virgibacillus sp. 179-BFC.A HS]
MQFPQIRMTSQMAKIQINQQTAVQTIRQPNAALSIQQPQAELNIHTTKGKLTIDQTQAFEDMNLMNVFRLTEKFAQAGREAALQGAERRAQQGEQLMK